MVLGEIRVYAFGDDQHRMCCSLYLDLLATSILLVKWKGAHLHFLNFFIANIGNNDFSMLAFAIIYRYYLI